MSYVSIFKHGRLFCMSALALCACSGASIDAPSGEQNQTAALRGGSFLITYKETSVPASAASDIARAGGDLVASYAPLGIVIARSTNANFASALASNAAISSVVSTAGAGVRAFTVKEATAPAPKPPPPSPTG